MTEAKELSLQELAIATLKGVCDDAGAPAAAKAQAARTILETLGVVGRAATPLAATESKDLSTVSVAELDAEIARVRRLSRP